MLGISGITKSFTLVYWYGTSGATTGKVTDVTYPSGNRVRFGYDAAGRVAVIRLHPASANGIGTDTGTSIDLLRNIGYAPFGAPTTWTWGNHSGTSPNTYARAIDLDGRVTSYPLGNGVNNGTQRTLTYDAASRIKGATHTGTGAGAAAPANFNQAYGYDDLDRLTGFTAPTTSQGFQYDANGNRIQATFGSASYTNTVAPASNRLASTTGPAPAKTNFYDDAGNLVSDGTISYVYADAGWVKAAIVGGTTVDYLRNGLGQRVRKGGPSNLIPGGAINYVYDLQGRLLGEYDINGKMLQETVYLGDLPVAVLKQTVSGGTGPLVDNADTAKVAKVGTWNTSALSTGYYGTDYHTHVPAASSDTFTWKLNLPAAGSYHVYARWTAGNNRATDAPYTITSTSGNSVVTVNQQANHNTWVLLGTYAFNAGVANVTLGTSASGYVIADAVPAASVTTTQVHYVYADHINTPRVITRASDNKMVWRWDHADPFGMQQPDENPSNLGVFTYNPRFPGQVFDKETNLHYNYFRDYDPQTGRYIQSDPIGLEGGINTYTYVRGNPLSFIDPLGLELMPVNLPGIGNTYLDSAFAPRVQALIDTAAASGVDIRVNSAYRSPQHQARLKNDPNAITPADQSLHSCGFAIDINFSTLPAAHRRIILDAATEAGLSCGGNFRRADPPHFYIEPTGERVTAIRNATLDYQRLTNQNR